MSRWIRGFSRLGVVLGAITGVVLVGIGLIEATSRFTSVDDDYQRFACLLTENRNQRLVGEQLKTRAKLSACGHFSSYADYLVLEWVKIGESLRYNDTILAVTPTEAKFKDAISIFSLFAITGVLLSVAIFVGCWLVGWIVAGFSKIA